MCASNISLSHVNVCHKRTFVQVTVLFRVGLSRALFTMLIIANIDETLWSNLNIFKHNRSCSRLPATVFAASITIVFLRYVFEIRYSQLPNTMGKNEPRKLVEFFSDYFVTITWKSKFSTCTKCIRAVRRVLMRCAREANRTEPTGSPERALEDAFSNHKRIRHFHRHFGYSNVLNSLTSKVLTLYRFVKFYRLSDPEHSRAGGRLVATNRSKNSFRAQTTRQKRPPPGFTFVFGHLLPTKTVTLATGFDRF